MSEKVNVFLKEQFWEVIVMDRKEFYKEAIQEYKENLTTTKYVEVVNVLLFDENWDLILQKRSLNKWHNPWMLDKTVWGHMKYWESPNFTTMIELVQEIWVPSYILNPSEDFYKYHKILKPFLETTAIVQNISNSFVDTTKIINSEEIKIWNKIHFYMWIYYWAKKNRDSEVKWILYYWFDELKKEIELNPNIFTHDLKFLITKYESEIKELISFIKNKNT